MLLRYSLNEPEAADAIEHAVNAALAEMSTPDIYEPGYRTAGTAEMGDRVCLMLIVG